MKKTYDRLAAGERIRLKRNLLGFTQDEMAEKIDRAENIMPILNVAAAV